MMIFVPYFARFFEKNGGFLRFFRVFWVGGAFFGVFFMQGLGRFGGAGGGALLRC